MKLGIDIGSTTVKLVLLDESDNIVYKKYERHMSNVFDKVKELLSDLSQNFDITEKVSVCITKSGGLSLATPTHTTIFAKTNPDKEVHGISAFIVDMSLPGVSCGKPEKKMGQKGVPVSDIILEDIRGGQTPPLRCLWR